MPIHFGTDGWRAVISDTFTFSNLRMVAQAIADAIASEHWHQGNGEQSDSKKFVVGFDTRFLSDRYAGEVARVMAANGFSVYLSQADAPTPAISYAIKYDEIIKSIEGGRVKRTRGITPPGIPGYADLDVPNFDLAKAKE